MKTRYLFVLPMLIFASIFLLIPVLFGIILPFFPPDLQNAFHGNFSVTHFLQAVSSGAGTGLFDAIRNTVIYTVCVSGGSLVFGLFGAVTVTQKFPFQFRPNTKPRGKRANAESSVGKCRDFRLL